MKLIFWGFVFIFLDFSITFNGVEFDLLPDAVGYLLVFLGAHQMRKESDSFARIRPIALVLAVINFVALIINPFGPIELTYSQPTTLAVTVFTLLIFFLYLYLLWQLVCAAADLEQYYGCPFGAHRMRIIFFIHAGGVLAPLLAQTMFLMRLAMVIVLVSGIAAVLLLVLLWRAAKTYGRLCSGSGPSDGNDEYYPGSED